MTNDAEVIYDDVNEESIGNNSRMHEIAERIDNQFFLESIKEQIENGLDCSAQDHLNTFNVKLRKITEEFSPEDYKSVVEFKNLLSTTIIDDIKTKYGIDIDYEDNDIDDVAYQLYSLFVLELKDIMVAFISAYIIEQYATMINAIGVQNLKTDMVPESATDDDRSKLIAVGNLGKMVDYIADIDLPFDEFINYAARSGSIKSIAEIESGEHILSINDGTEMLSTIMRSIKESMFDHGMMIQLADILISNFNLIKDEEASINDEDIEYYTGNEE